MAMKKYNPSQIEKKWQKNWDEAQLFSARDDSEKDKKYVLVEFPYPSGEGLHMGHLRSYTAADVLSRYHRMNNFEVMYPIGWDAFGLPAENYAIKNGVAPKISTAKNIDNIRKQCKALGLSFDWAREVDTTDPKYYRWTQWIFLQFYKAGLAYEATGLINWCPKDKTGLANEEVINGKCERCGTIVEKKELRQWYLKITAYAEKLLEGLKKLPEWPEAVKLQQENWIGKSTGAEIEFELNFKKNPADNERKGPDGKSARIPVFTTRPDTIFGATYLVLSPEHLWVTLATDDNHDVLLNKDEVKKYVEEAQKKDEIERAAEGKDKTGVELQGVKAINPATGEEISMWVADYVLGGYGTGAIMAVPAHDGRDFEFAKKFDLPIKQVVAPHEIDPINSPQEGKENTVRHIIHALVKHPDKDEVITLKWKKQPWHTFIIGGVEGEEDAIEAAKREVVEETGYKNLKFIKQMPFQVVAEFYAAHKDLNRKAYADVVMFELENLDQDKVSDEEADTHDIQWTPINELHKLWPVSELAYITRWLENGDEPYLGEGILLNSGEFDGLSSQAMLPKMAEKYGKSTVQYKLRDWVFSRQRYWGEPIPMVHCDKCGVVPVPEDQLPVLLPEVEKYEPTGTGESPLAAIDEWVNTTCPNCDGPAKRETNTMPQWAGSSWYYLRYADPSNDKEFASLDKLKHWLPVDVYFGGMEHTTLHLLYSRFWNIFLHDQGVVPVSEPYTKRVPHGIILAANGEKMSKSKGNVVNPDEIVKTYGADTARMYELFLGPHGAAITWNDKGIIGVARFLERVWYWAHNAKQIEQDSEPVDRALNALTKKITEDIENFSYNTSVAAFMEFHNKIKDEPVSKQTMQTFVQLLYPFAPHIAEEIYEILDGTGNLQNQAWPKFDESKLVSETAKIVVQVNGRVRDNVEMPIGSTEADVKSQAMKSEKVIAALAGAEPKRVIYVQDKLLNIVA